MAEARENGEIRVESVVITWIPYGRQGFTAV